ncbi:MAG: hypothetical protein KatS3mg058_2060 [Roseiflexus sp.]|nr:MAG: hypothetical protein KatS3mg058_2060 [Roseiflexus sp.]
MDECQIVVGLLLPADAQPTNAIHPGMRAFHTPAAGTAARNGGALLSVRATSADRGGRAYDIVLAPTWSIKSAPRRRMGAVEPHSATVWRPASSSEPLSRHRRCGASAHGASKPITIWHTGAATSCIALRLAPSRATPRGMPLPSVNRLRLVPDGPRSVGFGPVFPPQAARWSSHRPWRAIRGADLSAHRRPARWRARGGARRHRRATAGSGHGRWRRLRAGAGSDASDSRFAPPTRLHPSRDDPACVVGCPSASGVQAGGAVQSVPATRPGCVSDHRPAVVSFPSLLQPCPCGTT